MTQTRKPYRSAWQRDPKGLPEIRLQERDKRLLDLIFQYRNLSSDQATELYQLRWPQENGSVRGMKRRLSYLYHHGYLERRKGTLVLRVLQGKALSYIYGPGPRAVRILTEKGHDFDEVKAALKEPGWRYLEHALGITDFRMKLEKALKERTDWQLSFWKPEGQSTRSSWLDRQTRWSVNPDSYFALQGPGGPMFCFLEYDRATMSKRRLLWKIASYTALWQQKRHHKSPYHIPQQKPFKVLWVTISPERLAFLRQIAREADPKQKGGLNLFWFTEAKHYEQDYRAILNPIFQLPSQEQLYSLLDRHV